MEFFIIMKTNIRMIFKLTIMYFLFLIVFELRDEGQAGAGGGDGLFIPTLGASSLLRNNQLHLDFNERSAHACLPPVHPASGR